ncbi:MAG: glucosaminidase domain-containing protein [Rikenellaceae bacterium]|nr:glucosaminidase domain-containing protein [Rikenellaceae bacterium]
MKIDIRTLSITFAALIVWSVSSSQSRVKYTTEEYIAQYSSIAVEHQEKYGIPASITLAQGILESNSGNGRLAVEANNHFGIKCKKDWKGATISHDDDAAGECFRKYHSAEESYEDHANFIDTQPRYDSLFRYSETDYASWARGLKAAGYATDPKYAEKLIRVIEENKLYLYDRGENALDQRVAEVEKVEPEIVAEATTPSANDGKIVDIDNYTVTVNPHYGYSVQMVNGAEYVEAKEGDTYTKIAVLFNLPVKKIHKINDVAVGAELAEGERVFLQRKPARYAGLDLYHTAESGETMRAVAQRYGVRVAKLASLNRLPSDATLHEGQHVKLR